MFPVRHLAASRDGTRLVAAAFERTASLWELSSGTQVSVFDTVLDFGGQRIAINRDGTLCAAAAYRRLGLVCYAAETGSVVWQRADLKRLQLLSASVDGSRLYCSSDNAPCAVIEFSTGRTIDRWRGVRNVVESSFQPLLFLDRTRPVICLKDLSSPIEIMRASFAFLDVSFGPEVICLSESAGPVRAFNTNNGRMIWRYDPPEGEHALRVGYFASEHEFAAVECSFNQPGCPRRLVLFDADTGDRRLIADLGSVAETEFCLVGNAVITSDGQVVSTSSGTVIRTLWPVSLTSACT